MQPFFVHNSLLSCRKSRKQVQMCVKSVRKGCQMSMVGRIWEREKFWGCKERMTGWWMIRVVMMTLVRWDDRGEEMNQEKADQDVADEVSGEVDSWGKEMHREKKRLVIFKEEWVGGRARVTTDEDRVSRRVRREIKSYRYTEVEWYREV